MLAISGIAMGLVLGRLCGGHYRNLRYVRLRGEAAVIAMFGVQALSRGPASVLVGDVALVIWAFCSVILLLLAIVNRTHAGMGVAAAGIGANLLVILVNGSMPVMAGGALGSARVANAVAASHGFYTVADVRTELVVLGDVLPTPFGLASAGDLLLALGIATLLVAGMGSSGTDHTRCA